MMRPEGKPKAKEPYGPVGGAVVLVTCPKFPAPRILMGLWKFGWLNDIVEVCAEAECYPLRDLEILVDGEVGVEETGPR